MSVVDFTERLRKHRATTKGGAKHLRVECTNDDGWAAVRFSSNGKETSLVGMTFNRESYEKFDTELRVIMGWDRPTLLINNESK